jgi:hypothetical protein
MAFTIDASVTTFFQDGLIGPLFVVSAGLGVLTLVGKTITGYLAKAEATA